MKAFLVISLFTFTSLFESDEALGLKLNALTRNREERRDAKKKKQKHWRFE